MLRRGGQVRDLRDAVVRPLVLDEARLIARIATRDLRAFEQL